MLSQWRMTMVSLTVLAAATLVSAQAAGEWKPLFNGKDLTGWTVAAGRGGGTTPPQPAQWKVENGVLVGGHLRHDAAHAVSACDHRAAAFDDGQ